MHIHYRFHEILFIGYPIWLICSFSQQFKGNNLCIIEVILTKLYMQIQVIVIHNQNKFHEILSIGHLAIAHFVDFKSVQGQ